MYQVLKIAKRGGRAVRGLGGLHGVERTCPVNERPQTPESVVTVVNKTFTVSCPDQGQLRLLWQSISALQLCKTIYMRGDAIDVFHDCRRIREYIRIDPLQHIPLRAAGVGDANQVSVVDVSFVDGLDRRHVS